jgi:hypothetical protein
MTASLMPNSVSQSGRSSPPARITARSTAARSRAAFHTGGPYACTATTSKGPRAS